ncbi:hypothetical protein KFE25_000021 [Diacronema lutheri]|uniref:CRAL-TRIO domain-containing protein n=3 Tax=Diacronema lutheri TaxID=2081491 RepID=A0A8J6CDS8_DIALT|nr:hypothetical protein KFE25_000021 [Diacronema lutheri]
MPPDAEPSGPPPAAGVFDPRRNDRYAFETLRTRFAVELAELRAHLDELGVDAAEPGAPAEWGDAHLLRFVLGFGSGKGAALAFCRCVDWMREHDGAARRARFAAGAPLRFRALRAMRQLAPMQRIGLDRHGCPVIVHYLGQLKPRQIIAKFSPEEIRHFNMLASERTYVQLQTLSARDGVLRRSVLVLDLGGVGLNMLAPLALARLRSIISELTQVYVEMVDRVFFVRVPLAGWLQSLAYSLAPERSHHKFAFLGADFVEQLSEHVPREQLPHALLTGIPPADGWGLQDGDVDMASEAEAKAEDDTASSVGDAHLGRSGGKGGGSR